MFLHAFFVCWRYTTISTKDLPINDDIKCKEVRVIGPDGEQLGIMDLNAAKEFAYDRDLDLVLIAPTATPPVCRAMDYGKYCFERDKKEKEARKKQQIVKVKVANDSRTTIFDDVVCRVHPTYALAMHIDTDECNAACAFGEVYGEVIL